MAQAMEIETIQQVAEKVVAGTAAWTDALANGKLEELSKAAAMVRDASVTELVKPELVTAVKMVQGSSDAELGKAIEMEPCAKKRKDEPEPPAEPAPKKKKYVGPKWAESAEALQKELEGALKLTRDEINFYVKRCKPAFPLTGEHLKMVCMLHERADIEASRTIDGSDKAIVLMQTDGDIVSVYKMDYSKFVANGHAELWDPRWDEIAWNDARAANLACKDWKHQSMRSAVCVVKYAEFLAVFKFDQ